MKFLAILFVLALRRFTQYKPLSIFSSEQHWSGRFIIACVFSLAIEWVLIILSGVAYGLATLILQCLLFFYLVVRPSPAGMLDQYIGYVQRGDSESAYLHASGFLALSSNEIGTDETLEAEVFDKYVVLMFNLFFLPLLMFWMLGSVGLIFAVLVFDFSDDCPRTPAFFKLLRRVLQFPLIFTYYICGHSVAVWPVITSGRFSDAGLVAAAREAIAKDEKLALHSITSLKSLHERVLLVWLLLMGLSVIFGMSSPLY
ncbi:hypothetical protein [Neptunomonas sp.]|uniref:hypothetical protein n=1 Tax=Neptunomonas sp. TaxID=1971898 RepID=UPI00356B2722